jgi:hypothetical protein
MRAQTLNIQITGGRGDGINSRHDAKGPPKKGMNARNVIRTAAVKVSLAAAAGKPNQHLRECEPRLGARDTTVLIF